MNVCIIGYRAYTRTTRLIRVINFFQEQGYHVHYLGTKDEHCDDIKNTHFYEFLLPKYVGHNYIFYLFFYILLVMEAFIRITYLHIRNRFDIIFVCAIPDFLIFSTIIPKICGVKIVLDLFDVMSDSIATRFSLPRKHPVMKIVKFIGRRCINFSNHTIVVNHTYFKALTNLGIPEAKISTIMNVPDTTIFKSVSVNKNPSEFNLIFHGTIAKRLDVELAVRAAAQLKEKIPHLKMTIIGDGEDMSRLSELIDSLNLNGHIEFHKGFVPPTDLPYIISSSNVGLVTYEKSPATEYIVPTKLLEYIAVGIPSIVARLKTIAYYFDDSMVMFYEPGNVNDFAECVIKLYENPNLMERLVINSKKFLDKYNWNHQRLEYLNIIKKLNIE